MNEAMAATLVVPAIRRLSASMIDAYRACPKQLAYRLSKTPSRDQSSPVLHQASAIHRALDLLLGLPVEDRDGESAERALRAVWCDGRRRDTYASKDEERRFGCEAIEMMRRFAASPEVSAVPLAREQWLNARLPNGVILYGKVDRVDEGRGGIEVVDYKTGRRVINADDLAHEESAPLVYLILAEQAFGRPVECVRYLYLRGGEDGQSMASVEWRPERDDVDTLSEWLVELTNEIVVAEEWPATPGGACQICSWALQCVDRQRVDLAEIVPIEGLPF